MSAPRSYLDHNAASPLRPAARDAVAAALTMVGNPSSIHAEGRRARSLVETARAQVAALVGAASERVTFMSGATEAACLALSPALAGPQAPNGTGRLVVGATEHPAVLQGHRFARDQVALVPVGVDGTLDFGALKVTLARDHDRPPLLALQAANNETGVLQPLREAADLVHAAGGLLVCDAVQMAGRLPFDLVASGADAVLLSGHKLGGPQGTGAVVLAEGVTLGPAVLRGGGQERGARAGTENVAGLTGFGAAAEEAVSAVAGGGEASRLAALQARFERGLVDIAPDVVVFGADIGRLPNTTCFAVPGAAAEILLIALDLDGVAVSSGSACSSGRVSRSHVLAAMGVQPALAAGALRVSTGWTSTEADIDRCLEAFAKALGRIRARALPAAA